MPEIRHYKVRQVREVEVAANNATDACRIGNAAFEKGQNSDWSLKHDEGPVGIFGNTVGPIKEVSITAERK